MIRIGNEYLIDEEALFSVTLGADKKHIRLAFSCKISDYDPIVDIDLDDAPAQFEKLAQLLCPDHDPGFYLDSLDPDEQDECAVLLTNGWRYVTRDVVGVHAFEAKPCKIGAYWHLGATGASCRADCDFAALPDDRVLDLAEGKLI